MITDFATIRTLYFTDYKKDLTRHTPSHSYFQTYRTQDLISMAFYTSKYGYECIRLDVPQA